MREWGVDHERPIRQMVCMKLAMVGSGRHGILMENIGGTWSIIGEFLRQNVNNRRGLGPEYRLDADQTKRSAAIRVP
jgi:hypothetical protein